MQKIRFLITSLILSSTLSIWANEFVDVDVKQIAHYTGSIDSLRFYGEYKPRKLNSDTVSFPLNACDPVPMNTFGDLRYFFLSAVPGNEWHAGSAILIKDSNITNIIALRAKDDFRKTRIELYLGMNKNEFKKKGRNKIYNAQLLVIQKKTTATIFYPTAAGLNVSGRSPSFDLNYFNVKNLSSTELGSEIRKHLKNEKDFRWGNPEFIKIFLELLGDGWTPYKGLIRGEVRENVFTKDEAIMGNGAIHSNKVYWTQDENKLKGIAYKKK